MMKKKLTVCFSDISGFKQMFDTLGPAKGVDLLQQIYKLQGDLIVKYEGKIVKYIGDAILFTFEDPKKAIASAKEIVSLNENALFKQNSIGINVSIATGEVLLGEFGHSSNLVNDIFGDAVNTAALGIKEASRDPSHFVICPETQNQLQSST